MQKAIVLVRVALCDHDTDARPAHPAICEYVGVHTEKLSNSLLALSAGSCGGGQSCIT